MSLKQINPPYDGSDPCPMCNIEIRGAAAYVHNMLTRWPDPKAFVRLNDLRNSWTRPAELAVPHPHVTELMDLVDALIAAIEGMKEEENKIVWTPEIAAKVGEIVPRATEVSEKIDVLSDAHFDDARHASGKENFLCSQSGWNKIEGSYDRRVEVVEHGGDIIHTVCGTRFSLHRDFKDRIAKDRKFYGSMRCATCRYNVPFAQFEAVEVA